MFSQLRNLPRWSGKTAGLVLAIMPLLPLVGVAEPVAPVVEEATIEKRHEEATQSEKAATLDTGKGASASEREPVDGTVRVIEEPLAETEASANNLVLSDTPVAPMTPVPDDLIVDFEVSPLSAKPGESLKITGVCSLRDVPATDIWGTFYREPVSSPESRFDIRIESIPSKDGKVTDFTYTLPQTAVPGNYQLNISCGRDDMGIGGESFSFVILGDEVTPTSIPTAVAGSTPAVLAETGGGLPSAALWGAVVVGIAGVVLVTWPRHLGLFVKSGRRTR